MEQDSAAFRLQPSKPCDPEPEQFIREDRKENTIGVMWCESVWLNEFSEFQDHGGIWRWPKVLFYVPYWTGGQCQSWGCGWGVQMNTLFEVYYCLSRTMRTAWWYSCTEWYGFFAVYQLQNLEVFFSHYCTNWLHFIKYKLGKYLGNCVLSQTVGVIKTFHLN